MTPRRTALSTLAALSLSLPLLVSGPTSGAALPSAVTLEVATEAVPAARVAGVSRIEAGTRFMIRGRLQVHRRTARKVVLLEKAGRRLKVIDRGRTTRKGSYVFFLNAGSRVRTRTFVMRAPGARGVKAVQKRLRVKVVPRSQTPLPPTQPPTQPPVPPPPAPPPAPPRTPTGVTPAWTSTTAVAYSGSAVASGTVTGVPAGRTVLVQGQFGADWINLASATTDAAGSYSVALPTDWLRSSATRVNVVETATALGAVSEVTTTAVTPHYTPVGADPNNWKPIDTTRRVRFDPCADIRVKVNYSHAPAYARDAVALALKHARFATGYTFVLVGETTTEWPFPAAGVSGIDVATTDLLIGFGGQQHTKEDMSGSVLARGGWDSGWHATDALGAHVQADTAGVLLDTVGPPPGFTWDSTLMAKVLFHEIGHALGLGHAGGTDQIMSPSMTPTTPGAYGTGDLRGLSGLGQQTGCSRRTFAVNGTSQRILNDVTLP